MIIALLKLFEIGTRAIFIVLTTYALDLYQAGLFGFVVTLQGLASFAFGFERYVDFQRRTAGEAPSSLDDQVRRTFIFFCANYAIMLPVIAVGLLLTPTLSPTVTLLLCGIAVGEHLMNQGYYLTIVDRRYVAMLVVSSLKNVFILGALGYLLLTKPDRVNVETIMLVWAITLAVSVLLLYETWRRRQSAKAQALSSTTKEIFRQYRDSQTHFFLGLIAVLVLQLDRLAVGILLPLDQVGIYFRHAMIVGFIYQVFGILSANIIVVNVYRKAKHSTFDSAYKESSKLFPLILLAVFIMLGIFFFARGSLHSYMLDYQLEPLYFLALLITAVLRIKADMNAILFNGYHQERTILKLQLASFGFSAIVLVALTLFYSTPGTIVAGLIGAVFYLSISTIAIGKLRRQQNL